VIFVQFFFPVFFSSGGFFCFPICFQHFPFFFNGPGPGGEVTFFFFTPRGGPPFPNPPFSFTYTLCPFPTPTIFFCLFFVVFPTGEPTQSPPRLQSPTRWAVMFLFPKPFWFHPPPGLIRPEFFGIALVPRPLCGFFFFLEEGRMFCPVRCAHPRPWSGCAWGPLAPRFFLARLAGARFVPRPPPPPPTHRPRRPHMAVARPDSPEMSPR